MESFHVVGAQKLSKSSESGWTMYLASPTHCERAGVHSSTHDTTRGINASIEQDNDGAKSDDSMASDASSGPNQPDRCRGATRLKHAKKDENVKKLSTKKKNKNKNETTKIKGEKIEEEILQHRADSAASHI